MNDRPWLEFLDRIAIEKELTPTEVETLVDKFPSFNEIANDTKLAQQWLCKDAAPRLRMLYKAFDCLESRKHWFKRLKHQRTMNSGVD
jgi:hypothetical protein